MEGNVQNKLMRYGDVLMRVPLLFVIDELLRVGLGTVEESIALNATESGKETIIQDVGVDSFSLIGQELFLIQHVDLNRYFYENYVITSLKFIACCFGCIVALCIFVLSTRHLVVIYLYLISIGVIFVSYWSNVSTIKAITLFLSAEGSPPSILDDILSLNLNPLINYGPGLLIVQNYILQCILASIFTYIHLAPRYAVIQKLLILSFLAPSILGIFPLPTTILHHAPVFATLLPLAVSKFVIWYNSVTVMMTLHGGYRHARNFVTNYGMSALAETEWSRLNVPSVLRAFWILRVAEQVVQILDTHYGEETFTYYMVIRTLLVNGCETLTALLGMTSIISYICHYIGYFSLWVLMTEDGDEKTIGTVSAVLFYILALQTGLTSLDREKRLVRLYRNFCLLFTALLHFVHNIVNPLLMSLSASHHPALHRHVRALVVCAVLIIFPVSLLVFLWSHFTISTWLLAVSVFSVEVIVKVFVSLAIYSLFLFDAYRSVFWEQLDDCVYMIRSFGNTVEFSFGIVLFFNGFWILVFESGGAIRAIMMCIHAYFNIWCEATAGWSVFMKRRTAVNKINSLPEAKVEQLRVLDDVCAICYQEMRSAKVTRCNHYFHGVCLRKWLYIQDRCPLCHDILYKVQDNQANASGNGVQNATERSTENLPQLHNFVEGVEPER
ncbi:protein TRC8 homolog [Venturia canescens]|uniref:protein TRC8 homolog n=1 Tax=Venturia canescens TaxID=32260 RepID=UPI001C9C9E3F|nr:protein TRC8 homolog [Venturia canescens]XP_043268602.1 protein TRC8 homolog [Venturia canescens]XP_043268603.1 protein TRC8 homolog [Venturia canescens]XP_043268604.1 protein TRC8 homolog [Venturia canescens]XP_043268605.1 protein TRC8 homolog [Venturia canescens]XP_043268606.1 protein TRC8 homolog [Venturia canescens]XP_043268607.1 protein TRC8 homolog [Venturia canescens]